MLGYLSADITCSETQTVFRERSSRKTVSFEAQITSKDKYTRIFLPQIEAIVYIIREIFLAELRRSKAAMRSPIPIEDRIRAFIFSWLSWPAVWIADACDRTTKSRNMAQVKVYLGMRPHLGNLNFILEYPHYGQYNSCHNKVSADQYHLTISQAQV